MELYGIATALYKTEEKSTLSVTKLISESADRIFIEKTRKVEINPLNTTEVRTAFDLVLSEICSLPPQIFNISDQKVQVPAAITYGTPENHPSAVYNSLIRNAFFEYLIMDEETSSVPVIKLLEKLFITYHLRHGQPGSVIECKPFHLYLPDEEPVVKGIFGEEDVNEEFDRLHTAAEAGDANALSILQGYAREAARNYATDCQRRNIMPPRFVQYGPRNDNQKTNRYTALEWYNLRDIFVDELTRHMLNPHNICVKTPKDKPSPPFADICATQLADYWDILKGRQQKRHVYARYNR